MGNERGGLGFIVQGCSTMVSEAGGLSLIEPNYAGAQCSCVVAGLGLEEGGGAVHGRTSRMVSSCEALYWATTLLSVSWMIEGSTLSA